MTTQITAAKETFEIPDDRANLAPEGYGEGRNCHFLPYPVPLRLFAAGLSSGNYCTTEVGIRGNNVLNLDR